MNVVTRFADRLPLDAYLECVQHDARTDAAAAASAVEAIAGAAAEIAALAAQGPLAAAPSNAVAGEVAGLLDLEANRLMARALQDADVAMVNFEEVAVLDPDGALAVAIDPLCGAGHIETNAPAGTIFSITPFEGVSRPGAGRHQIAAGFVLYGAQTVMALTFGDGTHRFTLDPKERRFVRAHKPAGVPDEARDYAIDLSKRRHWESWLRAYVRELEQGSVGPRQRNFNLRWLDNILGETWRILERGGVYVCPSDGRPGFGDGSVRLCHEANPIAFLIEQAGGAACDGSRRILDIVPDAAHQSVPLVFGSKREVEHVMRSRHLAERSHANPLFGIKGLFRH